MKTPGDAAASTGSRNWDDHQRHRHHRSSEETERRHHHSHQHHTSRSGDEAATSYGTHSDEARALLSGSNQEGHVHEPSRTDHNHDDIAFLEKRILEKQRAAAIGNENTANPEPPSKPKTASSYEALMEAKQRSAGAAERAPSRANEQAADLDGRIDAKRAANKNLTEQKGRMTGLTLSAENVDQQDTPNAQRTSRVEDVHETGDEWHAYANVEGNKDGGQFQGDGEDRFHEEGQVSAHVDYRETESYYPNVETDAHIMAEIAQEGIQVDESGGIQAFVADTEVDEADVIGVIKSDEEVEREERREYLRFFLKSLAVIVFLIVVIGVPVTLKATKVIGPTVVLTPPPTAMPSSMPSQSPSFMPSSMGFTDVVEKLLPISGDKLMDVGSPQHRAARWISDEDPMQMDVNDPGFEQRYIMAVFYYSLDGDNWSSSDRWLSGESECNWEWVVGSGCLNGCIDGKVCAMKFGKQTSADFPRVLALLCGPYPVPRPFLLVEGWFSKMKGTLPDEMSFLTEMRYFELQGRDRDLRGTIPSGIGTAWTKVTAFLVNYNRLNGTFPFVNNPLLGTIFLNGNDFGGNLHSITSLKSLSWLEAEENKFSGTLPEEITSLESLSKLSLVNNNLSGAIPNTWTNSTLLERFLVSGNKLTGKLPDTIADAPSLRELHLARNFLSGSIPSSYYQMQSLKELYLDGNSLGGSLSQVYEPLYFGIREFAINNNTFEGRFPVE
ncbi:hypothetical protein ACHAW6_015807 [Cyclotella cf. meneghiniana]